MTAVLDLNGKKSKAAIFQVDTPDKFQLQLMNETASQIVLVHMDFAQLTKLRNTLNSFCLDHAQKHFNTIKSVLHEPTNLHAASR